MLSAPNADKKKRQRCAANQASSGFRTNMLVPFPVKPQPVSRRRHKAD